MTTTIMTIENAGGVGVDFASAGLVTLLIAAFSVPFVLSAVFTPVLGKLFKRVGFTDVPGEQRFSDRDVAKGGGVAIFWALVLPIGGGLLVGWYCWSRQSWPIWLPGDLEIHLPGIIKRTPSALAVLAGAGILHVLGLIDDRWGLKPLSKLMVQFAVAIGLVLFFEVRLLTFLPWQIGTVLTVVWIVLLSNVFNFLDNIDGLSVGVAGIVLIVFVCLGRMAGQVFVPTLATVLLGALAGFWLYNFYPARIFMGDSGSLPLGYLIAVVSVLTTYYDPGVHEGRWYGALAPLVVLAIPLYDFVSVVFLRLRAGARVWLGDRRHFSHRLIERGMSERKAVLTIYLTTATTAFSATLLPWVGAVGAVLIFCQTLAVVAIIALLESSGGAKAANQSG